MFGKSKNKNGLCTVCGVTNIIVGALAVVASLAAITGVYQAHVLSTGLVFGTTSGSLSLLALAVNLFLVKKASAACGCQCTVSKK